jgi:hypothetical protein
MALPALDDDPGRGERVEDFAVKQDPRRSLGEHHAAGVFELRRFPHDLQRHPAAFRSIGAPRPVVDRGQRQ